ncbi:AMP-binding protein [Candidatus Daviesbacteria bacterium]|nr:AMP-binding protein [Candidatus Daviesbacteria bacterium]
MLTPELLSIPEAICPDRTAIIFEGSRQSFAQLGRRSSKLADSLLHQGIKPGDRVAMLQVNTPEVMETYFACAKIGAAFVPIDFRAREGEIVFRLQDSGARVLFLGERYRPMIDALRRKASTVERYVLMTDYQILIENGKAENLQPYEGDETEMTVLMYTSGTTGTPKGVMLSHSSFTEYCLSNVNPADPGSEESNILTVPLYHIAGMQAMMAAVWGGRTLVLQRQFEPVEWMRLVQEHRVNRAMMVPTMLKMLIDHPDFAKYDLSSLKVITYGAAPMPLKVIERAISCFPNAGFINAFGQTESGATITMLGVDDHCLAGSPEEVGLKIKRLSSAGRALSGVQIKIVNADGEALPAGENGEIVVRTKRTMKGYLGQEAATTEVLDGEGYLHTGDVGFLDEGGYLFISGRLRDTIKRGGEFVPPAEVEETLMAHPAVADAAIIGVPDDRWGEIVRAIIVLKPGQTVILEQLREFGRHRLATYKLPESLVFVAELPRNDMGKVLKKELRARFGQP